MTPTALADVPTVLEGWTPRDPVDADAILANVRDILPVVDAEAATTSAQGFMTTRMGEALRQAGLYRVGFASWRGGPQLTLTQQTRMVEMIATRDASIAWNAAILMGSQVIYESVPFERLIRDLTGVAAHASTWRARWVDVGRTVLASEKP